MGAGRQGCSIASQACRVAQLTNNARKAKGPLTRSLIHSPHPWPEGARQNLLPRSLSSYSPPTP